MKKALTIAGSDPSGGAGIEADLKTFSAFGVYGMSVITAVTAQNSVGVQRVFDLAPEAVEAQLDSVLGDMGAVAAKTGMLWDRKTIAVVRRKIEEYKVRNLVVDPTMIASSGDPLVMAEDRDCLRELLPLATLVTPNLEEAEFLSGLQVKALGDMKKAAEAVHKLGANQVLIKGGHLEGDPVDMLYNGRVFIQFEGKRVNVEAHGTGCAFSAAIAAVLPGGTRWRGR